MEESKNQYKIIQQLANELIQISKIKKEKYPFKKEYFDKLLNKYDVYGGLYKIHLTDLPLYCSFEFNKNGYLVLNKVFDNVKKYGLDMMKRRYKVNFYSLKNFLNHKQKRLSVKKILSFIRFLNEINFKMDISLLEKCVIAIKNFNKGKELRIDGLPIDLSDKRWAIIFGSILDAFPKNFSIVVGNKNFGDDIAKGLKKLGVIPTYAKEGKFIKITGHAIIGRILSLAGIDIDQRQLIANNPLPLWIFNNCDKEYHSMILSKVLDTEGYSNKNKPHIRISQSSLLPINKKEEKFILDNSKETTIKPSGAKSYVLLFSRLNRELKEKVLNNPSLMLLSVQLLLRKYKINSTIYPVNVYISNNYLCSISWHLSIHTFEDIRRFYEYFGGDISIPYKKENILNSINQDFNSQPNLHKNLRFVYYLLLASEIEKRNGYFKIREIIEIYKRGYKTVYNTIGELRANKYIFRIGKRGKFDKLKVSQKGADLLKDYPDYKEFKDLML